MAYGATASRHVDLAKSESELAVNIRKATSIEETAPKRKHVRACIVYTWDHKSSQSFWAGMKVQPILADEVQTFKALITIHKVLQEGHQIAVREAQPNTTWLESLSRGVAGDGMRGKQSDLKDHHLTIQATVPSSANTSTSSWPSCPSTASTPSSMACSNTKSTSASEAPTTPTRDSRPSPT
jgi:ANTH domain